MTAILFLIAGLTFLTLSGDALVRGAVALARRAHVPEIVVGLTVISMGTSAPELFVSLEAAIEGSPGLAVGNAVGSNIANAMIVLGLPALFSKVPFSEPGIRRSATFMLGISLFFALLGANGALSLLDGLLLLATFAVYIGYSIWSATHARRSAASSAEKPIRQSTMIRTSMLLIAGLVGLYVGGRLTVEGALGIAAMFGLAETAVGATIVALGTSLPELAATLAAGIRGSSGVAIGNIIGSNIFNLLGILGLTSVVVPLAFEPRLFGFDLWVMIASSTLLAVLAWTRLPIGRIGGSLLVAAYLTYLFMALGGIGPV